MKKYKIDTKYSGLKISDYLKEIEMYSGRSLRNLTYILNGKEVKNSKKLRGNETLEIKEKIKSTDIKPIKMDLNIVFEDDNLLILDKEAFLITHPTKKKVDKTLANGIVYYFKEKYGEILVPRFYNRLDMNTTGLIIVSKNSFAQSFLQSYGNVVKKYYAVVEGIVEQNEIIIEQKIYQDGNKIERIIDDRGQDAKTKVRVLNRNEKENVSLVECELFTGRTHQIRVHLKYIGHPILGDSLYNEKYYERLGIKRQLLHAYYLEYIDPKTKETKKISIEIPQDMKMFQK